MNPRVALGALLLLSGSACGGSKAPSAERPPPGLDWGRNILTTRLDVDLASTTATASISLAPSTSRAASFEIGDLTIASVSDVAGPLNFRADAGRLDVGLPASETTPSQLSVAYQYNVHTDFKGARQNYTGTWPNNCGFLFPCKSDPADGLQFELSVTNAPAGSTVIFPAKIPSDAPSYMPSWEIGDYTYHHLGNTSAGTEVGVWFLPGDHDAAIAGTAHLRDAFEWYETTLGPYSFGNKVASVSTNWDVPGGMENHPYWQVASSALAWEDMHLHEAAHGWFGNGVRIACWEDVVLSEGTVSYLTLRAIAATAGAALHDQLLQSYGSRLSAALAANSSPIAWPEGCGPIDVEGVLFNDVTYVKGAFFFQALEARLGASAVDHALATFYAQYRGQAATMQQLLATILAVTGYDPQSCALAWLRSGETPNASACP